MIDKDWRHCLIGPDASIFQAISTLDRGALKLAMVVDEAGRLLGTITDGDIRRGLLRGVSTDAPLREILHRNPLVATADMAKDQVLKLMHANQIEQIPVVDSEHRVIGLHHWQALDKIRRRENPLIVMAGGKGIRMRPHTETCPKPLLPVAGRPILEHIVERARADGFRRMVFALHYLGHMIEEHFGDGSAFDVEITYLRETEPMGTAGALSLLSPVPDLPFVVSNGDVLTDIRYGDILDYHMQQGATATMAVRLHEWQHPFGVVRINGIDIDGFEEKPITRNHVNAGVYVLDPGSIEKLKPGVACDMPNLFETLKAAGNRVVAYPLHEPWLDIGRPSDLARAEQSLHG